MNVDLKKVWESMRDQGFPASMQGNAVTFVSPQFSFINLKAVMKVAEDNPKSEPWFFRSGKSVKVVFFIKNEDGSYLTS